MNGGSALHRSYRELARHDGCKVDPMPPYAALSATVAISGDGVRHRRCDY